MRGGSYAENSNFYCVNKIKTKKRALDEETKNIAKDYTL